MELLCRIYNSFKYRYYEEKIKYIVQTTKGQRTLTISSFMFGGINYVKEMLDKELAHYLEITRRLNDLYLI